MPSNQITASRRLDDHCRHPEHGARDDSDRADRQRIFVGVTDPIDPAIETAEQVRDRVLEAAEYIPLDQLGTTDDCGFAPFADDTSTARAIAFAKIRARVDGTQLAAAQLSAVSAESSSVCPWVGPRTTACDSGSSCRRGGAEISPDATSNGWSPLRRPPNDSASTRSGCTTTCRRAMEIHSPVLECWTSLAALARETSTVRLGQIVTCALYRNAGLLGQMAATVDAASGGRVVLGLGAGWDEAEYQAFGYGMPYPTIAERLRHLEETLESVRRLFAGPILVGGAGERVLLRLVAQHADACNLTDSFEPESTDTSSTSCAAIARKSSATTTRSCEPRPSPCRPTSNEVSSRRWPGPVSRTSSSTSIRRETSPPWSGSRPSCSDEPARRHAVRVRTRGQSRRARRARLSSDH